MKEIDGFKYSRESFEGYELRLVLRFSYKEREFAIDIYTTNTDKDSALENTLCNMKRGVKFVKMDHYATKKQDGLSAKFIDEWLEEL